jgi:hypothetical protein
MYNAISEMPKQITDQHWEFMLKNTFQIYDRQDYLRQVYQKEVSDQLNREEQERREKVDIFRSPVKHILNLASPRTDRAI